MKQVNHPAIVKRLKKAGGHLSSIIDMFDKERTCADLVQQLHAVEKAISSAKEQLIHDHMEHCLADDVACCSVKPMAILTELRGLVKYL